MSIVAVGDALPRLLERETPRPATDKTSQTIPSTTRDNAPAGASGPLRTDPLDEARALADEMNLEVRLYVIPGTQTINIRFVEPETGRVVREFPPENLVTAMAELRAQLEKHIDHQA